MPPAAPESPSALDTADASNPSEKRHIPQTQPRGKKRRRQLSSQSDIDQMELSDRESDRGADTPLPNTSAPRRSARARREVRGMYREQNSDDENDAPLDGDTGVNDGASPVQVKQEPNEDNDTTMSYASASHIDLAAQLSSDEEEKKNKPKMQMKLAYEGFTISKYKLCLVVQPHPSLSRPLKPDEMRRSESLLPARQGSILQYTASAREGSMAPPSSSTSMRDARSMSLTYQPQTPLFREPTPALPEQAETSDSPGGNLHRGEGDALVVLDDDLDSLVQLTQSFRERDGSRLDDIGIGGHDAIDFDADEDGVLGGDADE